MQRKTLVNRLVKAGNETINVLCLCPPEQPPQSPQVTPSEVSVAESEFKRKMKLFHVCCSSFCTKGLLLLVQMFPTYYEW